MQQEDMRGQHALCPLSTVHCPLSTPVSGCYSGQVPVYKNIDNINYNCPLGAKLSCIIAHRRSNKGIILDKIQFRP